MIKEQAAVTVRLGIGPAGAVFDLIRMAMRASTRRSPQPLRPFERTGAIADDKIAATAVR